MERLGTGEPGVVSDFNTELPDRRLVFIAVCRPLAAFEICTSLIVMLVVVSMSYCQTATLTDMILFRVIGAVKLLRAFVDVGTRRIWRRRGGATMTCWTMVNIPCIMVTWPLILGEIFYFISWHPMLGANSVARKDALPTRGIELFMITSMNVVLASIRYAYWPVRFRKVSPKAPPPPEITSFEVHDVSAQCRDSMCSICLDEFEVCCQVGQLPCGHVFHDECVRTWLKTAGAQCPMRCSRDGVHVIGRERIPDLISTSSQTSEIAMWEP